MTTVDCPRGSMEPGDSSGATHDFLRFKKWLTFWSRISIPCVWKRARGDGRPRTLLSTRNENKIVYNKQAIVKYKLDIKPFVSSQKHGRADASDG